MTSSAKLRLGTRASPLARWQADFIATSLKSLDVEVEMVHITTSGDVQQAGAVSQIGGQGVFTKEIQRALLDGEIDLAVHSLKDLPTEPVAGLILAAVPTRESCGDVLVANNATSIDDLAPGARVGTGSQRRKSQLLHVRNDLNVLDIRGNVETRLRKLDDGQFDAIILAEAGLKRLGLHDRITQVIPLESMLPAIGQGALGVECREDDWNTRGTVMQLDAPSSHFAVVAERALLAALRGGCMAPVGAWGRLSGSLLNLDGVVLSTDGSKRITAAGSAELTQATQLGEQVASDLLQQGAADLIAASRVTE